MTLKQNCFLKFVEIENFKSFGGLHSYGPFARFSAIVGPNGSGKSNFMDAVSFVMGELPQNLRVQRLEDLIHGASTGGTVPRSAKVTATIGFENGNSKKFTRSITSHASTYSIDDEKVSKDNYLRELGKLKVNVKAKNFLVFQGAVENIALRNPKELALLFEEMCGSIEHKEEYDNLNAEMQEANNRVQELTKMKRGTYAENKEAKLALEDAKAYQKMVDDLVKKKVTYCLFKLYFCEHQITSHSNDLVSAKRQLTQSARAKQDAEKVLQEKKNASAELAKEIFTMEDEVKKRESNCNKNQPQLAKAKEKVAHQEKKLEGSRRLLNRANQEKGSHEEELSHLEAQLVDVQQESNAFEEGLRNEGLNEEQENQLMARYNELKEQSSRELARHVQELDVVKREQKADQDKIENLKRLSDETQRKLRQRAEELESARKNLEKLSQIRGIAKENLKVLNVKERNFGPDAASLRARISDLERELARTTEMIGDASFNKYSEMRKKRKDETLRLLTEKFSSSAVYGRVSDLCQAVDERYVTAIAKVVGANADAIVVDCRETAKKCMSYLEDEMIEAEKFLAVSYLKVSTGQTKIHNPPGVRLLYDVIQYDDKRIEKAIRFVTQNAYVCETKEDAKMVAYGFGEGQWNNAVSMDGRYFKKDGTISGTSREVHRRIAEWKEKKMDGLVQKKQELDEQLKEVNKQYKELGTIDLVRVQIKGIQSRMSCTLEEMREMKERMKNLETEISTLEVKLVECTRLREEAEEAMRLRSDRIREIENAMDERQSAIFADFCTQARVANIREFEESKIKSRVERDLKRSEYENQKNRINQRIQFEKRKLEQMETNIDRWKRAIEEDENLLSTCQEELETIVQQIEADDTLLRNAKAQFDAKKNELDTLEEDIAKARREVGRANKYCEQMRNNVTVLEAKIYQKKYERHVMLTRSKLDGLKIPMEEGDMNDIEETLDMESMSQGTIASNTSDSQGSTQQYSETIFRREESIVMDYSQLDEQLTELTNPSAIQKKDEQMQDELQSLAVRIKTIKNPNLRADEQFADVQKKLRKSNKDLLEAQEDANRLRELFEEVKKKRLDKFNACFGYVSERIDAIYKKLTGNESAQAYLVVQNADEPYLGGINYSCVAPNKRYQSMSFLSGGEKTVAALALLFAIHSQNCAPFFILDEIDGALDDTNVDGVADFMCEAKKNLQLIVISLKQKFYRHADVLVGVSPAPNEVVLSSKMYWVDLNEYLNDPEDSDSDQGDMEE